MAYDAFSSIPCNINTNLCRIFKLRIESISTLWHSCKKTCMKSQSTVKWNLFKVWTLNPPSNLDKPQSKFTVSFQHFVLNLSCLLRPVQIKQRRQEEKATSCLDTVQTKPFAESCHSEKVNFPTEQEIEPTDQTSLSIHTSSRSTPRVQGAHVL